MPDKVNKCKHCGRCCIVCTDIQLTKEEKCGNQYKMIPRRSKNRLGGWSNMILERKQIWCEELKRPVFACFYFDQYTKKCSIYEDRPMVCRMFDCVERAEMTKLNIQKIWHKLREGNEDYYCLIG